MSENLKNAIRAASNKNPSEFADAIKVELADRVAQNLEAKKVEVSQDLLNPYASEGTNG